MINKHLLPANSTMLEKALAGDTQRIERIPVPFETLWDADKTPTAFLPLLAYAWSVDEWNDNWPESVQRNVIKQSVWVHQRKGTLGAVKRALAAMEYDTQVSEWFEMNPVGTAGTFSISVNPAAGVFHDTIEQIKRVIDAVKRLSAHYDIFFGYTIQSDAVSVGDTLVGVEITVTN